MNSRFLQINMEMLSIWENVTVPSREAIRKCIEESPSMAIDDKLRKKMGDVAVKAAKAARL